MGTPDTRQPVPRICFLQSLALMAFKFPRTCPSLSFHHEQHPRHLNVQFVIHTGHLPLELKIGITQDLPHPSLLNLSLVSREWQAPAQSALFQDFKFTYHVHRPLDEFVSFLRNSPHIGSCIFRLCLVGVTKQDVDEELGVEDVIDLVTLTPCLQQLIFHKCIINGPMKLPPEFDKVPGHPLKLAISDSYPDEMALYMLITRFCGTELSLHNVHLHQATGAVVSPALSPTSLSSLRSLDVVGVQEYRSGHGKQVTGPISRTKWRAMDVLALCPDTLTSLGAEVDFGDERGETLIDFLKTKGRHMVHLHLDLSAATTAHDDEDRPLKGT